MGGKRAKLFKGLLLLGRNYSMKFHCSFKPYLLHSVLKQLEPPTFPQATTRFWTPFPQSLSGLIGYKTLICQNISQKRGGMWEALQEAASEHRCKCLAGQRKYSWIRTRSSSNEGSLVLTVQAAGDCTQAGTWLSGNRNTALTVPTGEMMVPALPSWPQPRTTGAARLHLPAGSTRAGVFPAQTHSQEKFSSAHMQRG